MSDEMEKMLKGVDFTKGSDHKARLKKQLFESSDEIGLDDMEMVSAAAINKDVYLVEIPGKIEHCGACGRLGPIGAFCPCGFWYGE